MIYTAKGKGAYIVMRGKELPITGSWEMTADIPWYRWAWIMVMKLFKPLKFHIKAKGRGGYRPGSGRPKGSADKRQSTSSNRGGYRPGSGPKKGTKYKPREVKS